MPNHSNKQKESLPDVNFSASHDQARLYDEMSTNSKEFKKIPNALEEIKTSLQEMSPQVMTLAEQQDLGNKIEEKQTTAIKLVEYAQQVVENLHKTANKLNAIYQKSPEEKLKAARSLLTADKPLNQEEHYRFIKIEQALSNACIIKSAGDETIKFQLGVLANARENKLLSESEFNHLVILRLKENNLLDEHRLRIEGDMILEQTHLGICQAIDKSLLHDSDYQDSKSLFTQRLKGIDFELSLKKLDNNWKKRGYEKRDSLWVALEALNAMAVETKDGLETEALNLPEIEMTDPSYEANLEHQDLLYKKNIEKMKEIDPQLNQKKSKFVELMEEFIPKNKSKAIIIDTITPTPIEAIMRLTLERPSRVSDEEALRINFACNRAELENYSIANEKYTKLLADPSSSVKNNGDDIHEETLRKSKRNLAERDEKRKATKPCQLMGIELVDKYVEVVTQRLESRKKNIEAQISDLDNNYKKHFDEFSRLNLEQKHGCLSSDEKKQIRKKMFREQKGKLNGQLEETNQQVALWRRSETFIKNVYDKKADIIKKERIAFSSEELKFRDLVLNYDPNHEAQQLKINVFQDGVYLSSGKNKSVSTVLEKERSDTLSDKHSQPRLSANRTSHKEKFRTLSSSSFSSLFSTNSSSDGLKNQQQEELSEVKQRIKIKRQG